MKNTQKKIINGISNFKDLSKLSWKYAKKSILFSAINAVLASVVPLLSYWFSKQLFDILLESDVRFISIVFAFLVYIVSTIILSVCTLKIDNVVLAVESDRIRKSISADFHRKVIDIDLYNFDIPDFYDNYVRALNESETQIVNYVSILARFLKNIMMLCTTTAVAIIVDPIIFLILLLDIVAPIIFQVCVNKIVYKSVMERTKPQRFVDYVKMIFLYKEYSVDLRSTNVGEVLLNKYEHSWDELIGLTNKYQRKMNRQISLMTISSNLFSYAFPMLYLSYKVSAGVLPVSEMMALFTVISSMSSALTSLVDVVPSFLRSILFYENFKQVYDYKPQIVSSADAVSLDSTEPHEIEFRDVVFYYPNSEEPAINHLSFKIKKGEKVAILGENGAGKTTIIKLLLRLYEPQSGTIYIDGHDLRNVNLKDLRLSFPAVQQCFMLYSLSVRENISLIDSFPINDEKIRWAAECTGIKQYLDSNGYTFDNEVTRRFSDDGIEFSGGYSQRLAISRALASGSGNIIMDEPSAALDPRAEKELFDLLQQLFSEKTQIVITHRMTNANDFDKIMMIDSGNLLVEGTHAELMRFENKYKELYELQLSKYCF